MINLIDTTEKLEQFCASLNDKPFITIDLEFMREKTYYAELCLIQVGAEGQAAIIDPMSKELNLASFFDLLNNQNIVKVFHSGRQDIEILYNLTGKIPTPLFDTQIAAMVCGYGESAGYESLVKGILKIDLDKTSRCSNWELRPLDEKQLQYALSDVTHLVNLYIHFKQKLVENGRESWLENELDILRNPQTYDVDPYEIWHKIRHRSHNAKVLTYLRELAAWREKRAKSKNTPRQSIIKDDMLANIAAICPKNIDELLQIRNMRKDVAQGKLGTEILEVLEQCKEIPSSKYVRPEKDKPLSSGAQSLYELLKLLLKIRSAEQGVVAKLIATDEDLKLLSSFQDENCMALSGWRYDIFGKDAIELRNGNVCIAYDKDKHGIVLQENNPENQGC